MRWVWAAAVLLLVAVAACALYAHLLKTRTESLINSAYELSNRPANAHGLPFTIVRARYGKELKQLPGCTASDCGYEVVLTNRVFSFLHVLPYTELRSYFWVRNGAVIENMLDYTTAINRRSTVVAHATIQYCSDCTTFYLHPWSDSSPLDTNGFVSIGSASASPEKRRVLSLNPACMTRLRGCASLAELLPTVWEWTGDAIRCRIPNNEGMVDAPPGWWWLK
jgi:hypothetical protein